jgi:hypothetical protein
VEIILSILLVTSGSMYWNFVFPFTSIELIHIAFRSIKRDEKLVRSADRLR